MHKLLHIECLPEGALDATAEFHSRWVSDIVALVEAGADVTVILPAADHNHADWRRAAARDLARAHAPLRINIIAGASPVRIEESAKYLAQASGVTGQYLPLHAD